MLDVRLIFIQSSTMDWYLEVRRQTVFILSAYWSKRQRSWRSRAYRLLCTTSRAILAKCMEETSRRVVFWVDINLSIREGLTFYQTRSNASILQGTLPAYCIPKVVRLKTGEVSYERPYMSPRPPSKISLRHDHDWTRGNEELGSIVEQQSVGKLVATVLWRSSTLNVLPTNPTKTQTNLWSIGETWGYRTCVCC